MTDTVKAKGLFYLIKHDKNKIFLTGNTIVDVIHKYSIRVRRTDALKKFGLKSKKFFLATAHRAENVDNKERLKNIFDGLMLLKKTYPEFNIIFSIHPRTKKRSQEFGLALPAGIQFIEPVGYFTMLALEQHAKLIITDSGGIQEESSVLGIPCVTLRRRTERPVTIEKGTNILAGLNHKGIARAVVQALGQPRQTRLIPRWDGRAADRIVKILVKWSKV